MQAQKHHVKYTQIYTLAGPYTQTTLSPNLQDARCCLRYPALALNSARWHRAGPHLIG